MRPLVAVRRAAPFDPRFVTRHPLLWPLTGAACRLGPGVDFPDVDALNVVFGEDAPVRFVLSPPKRRRGTALDPSALYDARIALHREVPTRRRCWHDFMNALAWATYPRAKLALHSRQHRAIAGRLGPHASALPPSRSRELDALALLDEGGVVLLAKDATSLAACLGHRGGGGDVRQGAGPPFEAVVFGHAVFESLVLGISPAIVAAVVLERTDADLIGDADRGLADALADEARFQSPRELARIDISAWGRIAPSR